MITQIFAIPINPLPWTVPPFSAIRKGGKTIPVAGVDSAGAAFKEAVREQAIEQGGFIMEPGHSLEILTWRRRDQYKDKANRTRTKNIVDATNMQKLIEDALTGVTWEDDRTNIAVKTTQIEQSVETEPMIIIIARGKLETVSGGVGSDNWANHVSPDVRIEVLKAYEEQRAIQASGTVNVSNKW